MTEIYSQNSFNKLEHYIEKCFILIQGLKIRKQRSTGDLEKRGTGGSIRSNASSASWMSTESSQSQASASVHTDSNASFVIEVHHLIFSTFSTSR